MVNSNSKRGPRVTSYVRDKVTWGVGRTHRILSTSYMALSRYRARKNVFRRLNKVFKTTRSSNKNSTVTSVTYFLSQECGIVRKLPHPGEGLNSHRNMFDKLWPLQELMLERYRGKVENTTKGTRLLWLSFPSSYSQEHMSLSSNACTGKLRAHIA